MLCYKFGSINPLAYGRFLFTSWTSAHPNCGWVRPVTGRMIVKFMRDQQRLNFAVRVSGKQHRVLTRISYLHQGRRHRSSRWLNGQSAAEFNRHMCDTATDVIIVVVVVVQSRSVAIGNQYKQRQQQQQQQQQFKQEFTTSGTRTTRISCVCE